MDDWVASSSEKSPNESTVIKLPVCPRCTTPIRFTLRYLNFVKQQLNSIEDIKRKQYGDYKKNRKDREDLLTELTDSDFWRLDPFKDAITKCLEEDISYSANDLLALKNLTNDAQRNERDKFYYDPERRAKKHKAAYDPAKRA